MYKLFAHKCQKGSIVHACFFSPINYLATLEGNNELGLLIIHCVCNLTNKPMYLIPGYGESKAF